MINTFKQEIRSLFNAVKSLDRNIVIIFISIGVLQTISWYYTSRRFFIRNYAAEFNLDFNFQLYSYIYWLLTDFITLFILPLLIIKILLKGKMKDFGMQFGDYRTGLVFTGIFLLFMFILIWIVSSYPEFAAKYPLLKSAKVNWEHFLIFETVMLFYMFAWEFIWRGYLLFGLKEKFGYYAILIQMIPFVILHNGKPDLETFGSIIGGIALGILAWRTNSFIYCFIVHFGVIFFIDILSILRFRYMEYGIGLDSLFNLLGKLFGG